MKNFIIVAVVMWTIGTGCRQDCKQKALSVYNENKSKLVQTIDKDGVSMSMSYFPSYMLPNAGAAKNNPGDSMDYYYFKFELKIKVSATELGTDKNNLLYGADSLFVITDDESTISPVLVQPVIKGGNIIEYLLVFERPDVDRCKTLSIHFNDRIYTGGIQEFRIDKKIISLLETLSC